MSYPQNSGKPNDMGAGGEIGADGALKSFYTDCFGSRDCQIKTPTDATNQFQMTNVLPDCVIGGNCPEEGLHENVTADGTTIIRDTLRNHFNLMDKNSSFYQSGIGADAYRQWQSNDKAETFTRQGDLAEMHFTQGNDGSQKDHKYVINTKKGIASREYSHWKVNQETKPTDGNSADSAAEGDLNVDISGQGADKKTFLDFIDSALQVKFHVSKDGIEISAGEGQYQFLYSGGKLYALDKANAQTAADNTYIDASGNSFQKRAIAVSDGIRQALGLDEKGGVTVDGLAVHVDGNGKVTAQSTDSDKVTVIINADGTQTVGAADGYETRVGPDGRMLIFGPDHQVLGFFDPATGIIGNQHILLGADFSSFEGKMIDMMGMVYETANLRTSAEAVATADQTAVTALKQADTNASFVKGQIDSGTVESYTFSALNSSIGDLTDALGACMAADARDNLGAIITALSNANSQLSLATAKYATQQMAENMGVSDKFTLANVQRDEGSFGDSSTIARQAADSIQPMNPTANMQAMPAA